MNYNLIPDNVSEHTNVYDVLKERGFIEQTTDEEGIRDLLGREKIKFYIGFDPTADCLHVGHFMQVIIMMYMQKYGHTPVVLIGGGTTMIGDPSGRTDMRKIMTQETIRENGRKFKQLFDRFLDFDEEWKYLPSGSVLGKGSENRKPEPGKAICVNNADWLLDFNYLEFIRDIGSKFNVNSMLRAECFKQRMAKEGGLTFLEFNYMLLQAYDFYCLARDIDCKIEFGGNDQWSNIICGADLARKLLGRDSYYGMTFALLTNSEGKKMGKTQSGALWLSPKKTPPFEFYQYWRNVDDADVDKCLRMLTFLPMDEVKRLAALEGSEINRAKEILAYEVTKLVHGEEEAIKAQEAARTAFGGGAAGLADLPEIEIRAEELNSQDKNGNELGGLGVAAFLKALGLAGSNRDAMDVIRQGGLKLDGNKVTDPKTLIGPESFTDGKMLVEKGKKKKVLAKLV
ncbi:MAG: tyrosine--tRNA ligase [Bacillota bacterium]|nr:tyrosine--tRNA ligase [Bacillota bacterium]